MNMKRIHPAAKRLVAPCGMNCSLCSRYLAYVNGLKRSSCAGCRTGNRKCTYLFAKCTGINNDVRTKDAAFCSECEQYPCAQIDRIEKRYDTNYGMSMKENLEAIKKKGVAKFIDRQYRKYRCPACGGWTSIHNGKCFHCVPITKLVEKTTARVKRRNHG